MQGPEVGNPDGMHGYQALEDHLNQDQQQQWAGIEVRQVTLLTLQGWGWDGGPTRIQRPGNSVPNKLAKRWLWTSVDLCTPKHAM